MAGYYANILILEDDTLQTSYLDNIFYAYFTSSGDFVWLREIGAWDRTEQANGVARDDVGNLYFTGMSANYSDDPDSSGHPVALVLKVDTAGVEVWRTCNPTCCLHILCKTYFYLMKKYVFY